MCLGGWEMEISYNSLPGVPRSNGFLSANYYSRSNPYDGSSYYTDETEPDWSTMTNLKEFIMNNNNISTNHIPFSQARPYKMRGLL